MSEFAPKRRRGSFVVIVAMGMTLGGFSAAITSSFLRPEQWQLLFLIGGLVPLALVPVVMCCCRSRSATWPATVPSAGVASGPAHGS